MDATPERATGTSTTKTETETATATETAQYEHLVLSGGGADGIIVYGAVRHLVEEGVLQMDAVRTIHAVSVGSLLAVSLLLGYEMADLDDYVVRRPWHKAFTTDGFAARLFSTKGMFDSALIVDIVRPLLEARDVPLDVTLSAFAERTGVALYLYTVNVNVHPLRPTELSAEAHPDMPLALALQMTCCYPMVFSPVFYKGGCYVDGGMATKFPLRQCVERVERANPGWSREDVERHILAFTCCEYTPEQSDITPTTGVVDYARHLIELMNSSYVMHADDVECANVVRCFNMDSSTRVAWYRCAHESDKRHEYVVAGGKFARLYLKTKTARERLRAAQRPHDAASIREGGTREGGTLGEAGHATRHKARGARAREMRRTCHGQETKRALRA